DQFAGHEWESHKKGCQYDSGQGEDDPDVMSIQPLPAEALQPKKHDENKTGYHGRNREGQIDERHQHCLAAEFKLCDGPSGGETKRQIERNTDQRDRQRKSDCSTRVRVLKGVPVESDALAESLGKDVHQWQAEEHQGENKPDANQEPLDNRRLFRATLRTCRVSFWIRFGCASLAYSLKRLVHDSSQLMRANSRNEMTSRTTASAIAPA